MKKNALLFLLLFCNMLHSQSFSIRKTLDKCREINQEIENEQDETIWAKRNQDLKKIVLSNIKIKTLSENEKKEFFNTYLPDFMQKVQLLKLTEADMSELLTLLKNNSKQ
jgi:hypothetical protein